MPDIGSHEDQTHSLCVATDPKCVHLPLLLPGRMFSTQEK